VIAADRRCPSTLLRSGAPQPTSRRLAIKPDLARPARRVDRYFPAASDSVHMPDSQERADAGCSGRRPASRVASWAEAVGHPLETHNTRSRTPRGPSALRLCAYARCTRTRGGLMLGAAPRAQGGQLGRSSWSPTRKPQHAQEDPSRPQRRLDSVHMPYAQKRAGA
jgi:hypothetical protein